MTAQRHDDEFELWDLRVEVVGDPDQMVCAAGRSFSLYALAALLPLLPAKQRMTHPNDWMTTDAEVACPDPYCGARFRITRTAKTTFRHSETTVVPLTGDNND